MKITSIQECGSSNLLKWAINNGADIKNDRSLQAIINAETFYQITLEDVNYLELFRLTQSYREKVHIRTEKKAEIPSVTELAKYFPGEYTNGEEKVKLSEIVEHACKMFLNLAIQMNSDDDIIRHDSARLFLPMISRRFDIDIPLGFIDLVAAFQTPDDAAKLFNANYPNNLNEIVLDESNPMVMNMILLYLIKSTSIIKYEKHYEQLLRLTKYAPLRKCTNEKLYKFRMAGFSKYNNITRAELRCSFFNMDKAKMEDAMKKMESVKTPLKVDFVVQLPIQYMQILQNSYTNDELPIMFESSMSSIIEGGLVFNDFVTREFDVSFEDEKIQEYNNAIEAYKTRINEANQTVLNSIPIILNSGTDVDFTNTFAMLPPIYTTKAVITINMEYADRYLAHYDANIRNMLQEMVDTAKSLKM